MWRALGPNLDKANVESIFELVDQDCCNYDINSVQTSTEDNQAVAQIAKD